VEIFRQPRVDLFETFADTFADIGVDDLTGMTSQG
jgi:hypothetical protein